MSTEREDAEARQRFGESGEEIAVELRVREAGACMGKMLIDEWHFPPDAVAGFLEETYQNWKTFQKSLADPETWVLRRIVRRAREYMDHRDAEPAGPAPHIMDVVRNQAALDTLPERARTAFVLYVEGQPFEAIARQLDCHPRYAKKLVGEALNVLRRWRP